MYQSLSAARLLCVARVTVHTLTSMCIFSLLIGPQSLLLLQKASVLWQTLDVFDFAKLSTLKCEPYQRLGNKNAFSFKLGIGFGSTLQGLLTQLGQGLHICS